MDPRTRWHRAWRAALLVLCGCASEPAVRPIATPRPQPPPGAEATRESTVEREARRDVERELEALARTCRDATDAHEVEVARAERVLVGGYIGAVAAIAIGRGLSASTNGFEVDPGEGRSSRLARRVDSEKAERDAHLATFARDLEALDDLFAASPDPSRWTADEWRAFHERITRAERDCRGFR